jgi:hypothetical protein
LNKPVGEAPGEREEGEMRRLRGIAASARVLHSPTSGRTTTLQELPTGGLEGGAAAVGGGLAADASTSSSYGSLSSSGSSEGGGFPGSPGFSFPLVPASDERDPLFEDDEEEQQARDLMRRYTTTPQSARAQNDNERVLCE